jgi:hypothetical protein
MPCNFLWMHGFAELKFAITVDFSLPEAPFLTLLASPDNLHGRNPAIEPVAVESDDLTPVRQIRVVSAGLCAPAHRRPSELL